MKCVLFLYVTTMIHLHRNAKNQELSMNIKNLVNDAYAKDISAKERAAKRTAQKNGEYVGATAPYGYCCEKINGIYKLVKEPESAKIVQRILRNMLPVRRFSRL